ncbi:MAG TPA: peptidase M16 [Elusimicrobia bacterium]|nr:peptidase M16 [Elusimicrobiota bacterium]
MRGRMLLAAALALLSATGARGSLAPEAVTSVPAVGPPAAARIDFSSFTLRNGMRVLVSRDASVPVVAVAMIVGVGGRHEARGRSGFAHLFEHMMFEGSAHVPKGGFDRFLESFGGDNNASTHEDFTFYYEELPSNALAVALWLDADRIGALRVTRQAVKNQIEVVKEEKRMRVDNQPYGAVMGVEMAARSFENWQNAHPVIGSFEDLDAASLKDVKSFFDAYYSPDNITMAVVGDADPAEVRRLVTAYFTPIKSKPRPAHLDTTEPDPRGERAFTVKDEHAKLPALGVTWKGAPARGTVSHRALVLLGNALFSGKSSRLYQSLVKESRTAVSVEGGLGFPLADWDEYQAPGLFGAFIVHKKDQPFAAVKELIAAQTARVAAEGLAPEELERVKVKFRSDWVRAEETRLGRARRLLQSTLLDGDPEAANRELSRILAVTNEDIRRAAAAHLKAEAATWFEVTAGGVE